MVFCQRFQMTPLEYLRQPADVILRWYRMATIEGEERAIQDRLASIRTGRAH